MALPNIYAARGKSRKNITYFYWYAVSFTSS
jgi:hypothetical protein